MARYDVQVRVEDGPWPWTDWLTDTLATGAEYHVEEGIWFAFQVTATDQVGNEAEAQGRAGLARVTKYYAQGSLRVAMRVQESRSDSCQAEAVYWLHGDHLGSTSLTTNGQGKAVARQLYHPDGSIRYSAVSGGSQKLPARYQRISGMRGSGLMFYRARYYHVGLGRFVSADTIVPELGSR